MRAHVVYESRRELTRLLYGDFDPAVTAIYAQPFLLSAEVDGSCRSHVPDFMMVRDGDVPLVVDVKPRHLLTAPKVAFSLGWAREVVESRGWEFQVWTEPSEAELANLRFLAGYRRGWLFDPELLAEVREMAWWVSVWVGPSVFSGAGIRSWCAPPYCICSGVGIWSPIWTRRCPRGTNCGPAQYGRWFGDARAACSRGGQRGRGGREGCCGRNGAADGEGGRGRADERCGCAGRGGEAPLERR